MKVIYTDGGFIDGTEPGRCAVVSGLEPDEPVFVVRGRDALALGFVTLYQAQASAAQLFDHQRSESLAADIQKFVEWRRKHVERVRDPD